MGRGVVATIISYNRRNQLRNAIEAVLAQNGADCDVIVIDNGSTDGTREMVEGEFSSRGVLFIDLGKNTGCAGGINCALRVGLLENYDRVWIMDDDVVPEPTALAELLYADRVLNGKWGFMSSAAYWTDGSLCKANKQKKDVFRFVGSEDYEGGPVRIMMASICSLFLNIEAVKEVGLPISEYFFYTEDYEFTSRIARKYPCYLIPRSKVSHDMKVNAKASIVSDTEDRMWRYGFLYRNDVHCYRRLGPMGWAYLVAKAGYTTADILLHEKNNKFGKLKVLYGGLRDGIGFNPPIETISER